MHASSAAPFAGLCALLSLAAGCGAGGAHQPQAHTSPSAASAPASPSSAGGPTGFQPAAVSFVSPGQGWVLGRTGCSDCAGLRETRDGGAHWTALPAPPTPVGYYTTGAASGVRDLAFADTSDGFLFGPWLLATYDGGRSWARQPLPPVQALAVAAGHAYALTQVRPGAPFRAWRTIIGARRWTRLPLPAGYAAPRLGGSDYGTLLLSAEGHTVVLLQAGFHGHGLTSGQAGRLWASGDEGASWQARPVPCTPADGGAAVLGIALGHTGSWLIDCYDDQQSSQEQNTRHHLYGTSDAGLSWVRLPDPTRHNLPELLADNGAGRAFLATEGVGDTLQGTLDGGLHWRTMIRSGGSFFGWADLRFLAPATGFVVGPTHYAPEHVYRTDDGGRTWRILPVSGPAK
jgi:photosystem II stability/assembly factor-like uncharacterized protein